MPTATANLYEIMFLISQATASNLSGVLEHINHLIERAEGEVVAMQKWDERRLAYEIDKQKRGLYLLAYVKMTGEAVAGFERDCNLSELLLRTLVLRADHLSEEEAAAFDRRDDLAVEARMRAEAGQAQEEQSRTAATLGAPTQDDEDDVDADLAEDEDEDLDD
ncbi:MAG: hypothetical protein Kow0022_03560 [Phycisphaerales bacterium]